MSAAGLFGAFVAVPPDGIAAALAGEWRLLITGTKLYGASPGVVSSGVPRPASVRFVNVPA